MKPPPARPSVKCWRAAREWRIAMRGGSNSFCSHTRPVLPHWSFFALRGGTNSHHLPRGQNGFAGNLAESTDSTAFAIRPRGGSGCHTRILAERIMGLSLDGETDVRDLAAADDAIKGQLKATLKGVKTEGTPTYHDDGRIEVVFAP